MQELVFLHIEASRAFEQVHGMYGKVFHGIMLEFLPLRTFEMPANDFVQRRWGLQAASM